MDPDRRKAQGVRKIGQYLPCDLKSLTRGLAFQKQMAAGGIRKPLGEVLLECRACLLYTSPSPRDLSTYRMPSSA